MSGKRKKGRLAQAIEDHYANKPMLSKDDLEPIGFDGFNGPEGYDEAYDIWLERLDVIIQEHFPHTTKGATE